jgi:hypothetical protein
MPAAAVVIALFMDGVQVLLPAPAFLEGGTSWVPARVVLERSGCQPSFDEKAGLLTVTSPAQERYSLTPYDTPAAPGAPRSRVYTYRNIAGYLYITAESLTAMARCSAELDRARLRLNLQTAPVSAPAADVTPIGRLLSAGPEAIGKTVVAEGEYLGRSGGGDGNAWLLRGDGGTLQCTSAPDMAPPFPMTAYGDRGCRLRVRGTAVGGGAQGIRVRVSEATRLSASLGVACLLEFARPCRDAGLRLHLVFDSPAQATAPDGSMAVTIRARSLYSGNIRQIAIKSIIMTEPKPPARRIHAVFECQTEDLAPGSYAISAVLPSGDRTYEAMVRLGE